MSVRTIIMKTFPLNVHALKPCFYVEKLRYAGVEIFFLFFAPKHSSGSNEYPQSMFWSKNKKKYHPIVSKESLYIARASFRNVCSQMYEMPTCKLRHDFPINQ